MCSGTKLARSVNLARLHKALNGIQFGSVGRQPLDVQPVGVRRRAGGLRNGEHSVDPSLRSTGGDADDAIRPRSAHYMRRADVLFLYVEEDGRPSSPWRDAQAADDVQSIMSIPSILLWPNAGWLQVRRFKRCRRKPVSSRNTMVAWRRSPPF